MKEQLKEYLKSAGAFDVGIASPDIGYEKAAKGFSPKEVWPECRSVVVFAVAMSPETNNTYLGPYAPHEGEVPLGPVPAKLQSTTYAMNRLARQITAPIIIAAHSFLEYYGYRTTFRTIQCKLSGYLSGLGVYGRSGILINPCLGNRMSLAAVMTSLEMEPDSPLTDFHPCENCSMCIKACPAGAFSANSEYPDSWSREKCTAKRTEIAGQGSYCHNCFAVCPAGTISDDRLVLRRKAKSIISGS